MSFFKKKKETEVEDDEATVYVPDDVLESGDNRPAADLEDNEQTENENSDETEDEQPEGWSNEELETAKIKTKSSKKSNSLIILIAFFAALLAAGGIFIWMLSSYKTTQITTAEQVKATTATAQVISTTDVIPQFTDMTIDEISTHLNYIKVYTDAVPEGAITDPSKLVGLTTNHEIAKNAILTEKDFSNYGSTVTSDTVEISFPVEDLGFSVAGNTIPGNKIILGYIDAGVFTEFYETTVYKMYNASGESVTNGADATIFTVLVPRTDATTIYTHIQQGTMVIEKMF